MLTITRTLTSTLVFQGARHPIDHGLSMTRLRKPCWKAKLWLVSMLLVGANVVEYLGRSSHIYLSCNTSVVSISWNFSLRYFTYQESVMCNSSGLKVTKPPLSSSIVRRLCICRFHPVKSPMICFTLLDTSRCNEIAEQCQSLHRA
jgi:hypothetical protein